MNTANPSLRRFFLWLSFLSLFAGAKAFSLQCKDIYNINFLRRHADLQTRTIDFWRSQFREEGVSYQVLTVFPYSRFQKSRWTAANPLANLEKSFRILVAVKAKEWTYYDLDGVTQRGGNPPPSFNSLLALFQARDPSISFEMPFFRDSSVSVDPFHDVHANNRHARKWNLEEVALWHMSQRDGSTFLELLPTGESSMAVRTSPNKGQRRSIGRQLRSLMRKYDIWFIELGAGSLVTWGEVTAYYKSKYEQAIHDLTLLKVSEQKNDTDATWNKYVDKTIESLQRRLDFFDKASDREATIDLQALDQNSYDTLSSVHSFLKAALGKLASLYVINDPIGFQTSVGQLLRDNVFEGPSVKRALEEIERNGLQDVRVDLVTPEGMYITHVTSKRPFRLSREFRVSHETSLRSSHSQINARLRRESGVLAILQKYNLVGPDYFIKHIYLEPRTKDGRFTISGALGVIGRQFIR